MLPWGNLHFLYTCELASGSLLNAPQLATGGATLLTGQLKPRPLPTYTFLPSFSECPERADRALVCHHGWWATLLGPHNQAESELRPEPHQNAVLPAGAGAKWGWATWAPTCFEQCPLLSYTQNELNVLFE